MRRLPPSWNQDIAFRKIVPTVNPTIVYDSCDASTNAIPRWLWEDLAVVDFVVFVFPDGCYWYRD